MEMTPEILDNFGKSLLIMLHGMEGIFVVILFIMAIVWGLGKLK